MTKELKFNPIGRSMITERNIFTGKRKFMGLNWSKIYALPIQLTNAK